MEPKKLLSVETLEKKKNFTERYGIVLLPNAILQNLNDIGENNQDEGNIEEVKIRRPKM